MKKVKETDIMVVEAKLAGLYHKGQEQIWDGREHLKKLFDKHHGFSLTEEHRGAIERIFAVIFWGELAAWKISAALAANLEHHEARMAATSQAHDEARHFYVMQEYLERRVGRIPDSPDRYADAFLKSVLRSDSLPKMLLGMQLMVEPLALTLFKIVREREIDPVLSELLLLYERDEARHVALGTLYLPTLLKDMSYAGKADLLFWQFREYMKQFNMLKSLANDFVALGIEPRTVFDLAKRKQVKAIKVLAKEMGEGYPLFDPLMMVIDFKGELDFPEERNSGYYARLRKAFEVVKEKRC
jgi:hypothetical protein